MNIFVYGTLRTHGALNHHLAGCRSLGPAATRDADFGLIDLGFCPGAVKRPCGVKIKGELFECPESWLDILDQVEGYPSLYTREKFAIECEGKSYEAWVYLYNASPTRDYYFIPHGEWEG